MSKIVAAVFYLLVGMGFAASEDVHHGRKDFSFHSAFSTAFWPTMITARICYYYLPPRAAQPVESGGSK